jgi:WD40 repeat protein
MSSFKNVLLATGLSLIAWSSFSAAFSPIIKPSLVRVIGTDDYLFMSKFSGLGYQNHDGTKLVVACSNGTFEIAVKSSDNNFVPFETCSAYEGVGVKYVNFSPSGNRIISTSQRGQVKVWDLECKLLSELDDPTDSIHLATFGDNDDEIFTNSMSNINKLWRIKIELPNTLPKL